MITFEPRQPIKAEDINANFAEASSGGYRSGAGQFGTSLPSGFQARPANEPLPAGCIYVRLDYPFRAPMGAVVGIDFPIREQTIEDSADVQSFLHGQTVYSCQKNQYRHHNRIGVLKQELKPGEIGIAVLSGVAKTFWHAQLPPYSGDHGALSPDDTAENLPSESTNAAIDEYRQLATLSADFERTAFSEYGESGSEHYYVTSGDEFFWRNRDRPWWFAPYPRLLSGDTASEVELQYPYDPTGGNDINYVASSRGRAMGLSAYTVPEPSCTGTSTATCRNGHWVITATTCNVGCSSWHLIERNATASETLGYGLMLPCTEDAEVADLPCGSDFPYADYIQSPDSTDYKTAPVGAWEGVLQNVCAYNWLIGGVVLGTPEAPGVVDSETATEGGRGNYWMAREFPNPYASISDSQWSIVLRACANLTCTYQCDGTDWQLVRGETPYNLDQYWRCKCPDEWMELMADHELPCGTSTMPREFTVGMVFDSANTTTTTTTTTTSTTTTTTAPTGACCYDQTFSPGSPWTIPTFTQKNCIDGTTQSACDALDNGAFTVGASCDDIALTCHKGACCFDNTVDSIANPTSCGDDYLEWFCVNGSLLPSPTDENTWGGVGSTCASDPCGLSTTSSTTTSTAGTTTSSTTTTTAATGACCVSTAFPHCEILTAAECAAWGPPGTYMGDGVPCSDPDPCETTSSTTTSTAGTTTSSTTTSTSAEGACCYLMDGTPACLVTYPGPCAALPSGTFQGAGTSCFPDPC